MLEIIEPPASLKAQRSPGKNRKGWCIFICREAANEKQPCPKPLPGFGQYLCFASLTLRPSRLCGSKLLLFFNTEFHE
jgi:hypothetical protein